MNDVSPNQERYFESRLLHGNLLHLIGVLHLPHVEERAHPPIDDGLDDVLGNVFVPAGYLKELSYFFTKGHHVEVYLDGFLDVLVGLYFLDHRVQLLQVDSFALHFVHVLLAEGHSHFQPSNIDY